MERYIAIDNACAWPNLTLLPDGALAAIIFNQPTHGGWEGDVECWASEDGGRLWRRRGVVARHDPGENRMNVAAGRARDGSLVVLASGWSRRNAPGEWTSPHRGEVLPVWVCRSRDGGATWEHGGDGASFSESAARQIPFGDIVALPDGTLGASLYDWALEAGNTAHFYVSSDDGETWTLRGTVQAETANETTPVVLPDGRVLADVIIPYDRVGEMFGEICDALGVAQPLERRNVSRLGDAGDIPAALRAGMREFYAQDYALLARLDEINAAGMARLRAR